MCKSLIGVSGIKSSKAMLHGKNYEGKALKAFSQQSSMKASKCGFFVCQGKPFLGASPDAVIDNNCIVEIKCPYNGRNDKIIPGDNFKFLKHNQNGNVVLNTESNYYQQVQGQLYVTNRKVCYFVVYTFSDLFIQKIEIDLMYCEGSLLPKLELFYTKHFRPYIASNM